MNKGSLLKKWDHTVLIIYVAFILIGIAGLIIFDDPMSEGLGWGMVFCPILGYSFYFSQKDIQTEEIENSLVYLILVQVFAGVGLVYYASKIIESPFACGIGTALAIFGGLAFSFELIRRLASQI